jgi:hypothetical protein
MQSIVNIRLILTIFDHLGLSHQNVSLDTFRKLPKDITEVLLNDERNGVTHLFAKTSERYHGTFIK